MARKPTIRWRESDAQRLEKYVERFNAKIYRTRARHPELKDILPETIKKADKEKLIENLQTQPRSEFRKQLNTLERFTRRGSEQEVISKTGNRVTQWEKREVGLKVAQINRERTRERQRIEQLEATSRGEPLGFKRGEMGGERFNALKPKQYNFDKIRGGKEWVKFKTSVERQASPMQQNIIMEQYKENYLKGLDEFGGYADNIKDIIKQLPADLVVETYYKEQEATISFYYEGVEGLQDKDAVLDILEEIWSGVLEEYEANG